MNDKFKIPATAQSLWEQLSGLDAMVCFMTADLAIWKPNAAAEAVTGYTDLDFESNPFILRDALSEDARDRLQDLMKADSKGAGTATLDLKFKTKSGAWRWIRSQVIKILDDHTELAGYFCINSDTSAIMETAAKARQERDRAQEYLNLAGDIMVALDSDHRVTLINRKGCEILKVRESEILGQDWIDRFVPEADREHICNVFRQLMAGKIELAEYYNNAVETATGDIRYIAWHNALLKDSDGRIIGTLSSGEDVTERKAVEDALKQSEDLFRALFEGTHGCILFIENRVMKYVNQATVDTFGYTRDELLGSDTSLINISREKFEEGGKLVYEALQQNGSWQGEWPYRRKDGSIIWMDSYISALSDTAIVAVLHDISDRKEAQAALEEREAKLSSVFRASPIGIGVVVDRVFTQVNERLCEMMGYAANELLHLNARLFYPTREEYDKVGKVKYDGIRQSGTGTVETRWIRKDGKIIDVLLSSTPLDTADLSRGVTFTALDITERKEAEQELQRIKENLDRAQQIAQIGSFEWDIANDTHFASDEAYRILGVKPESIEPSFETFLKYVHKDDMEKLQSKFNSALESGYLDFDHRIVRPDGNVRVVHQQAQVSFDTNHQPVHMSGTYRDITDQKEAEQALLDKNVALREVLGQIAAETKVVKQQIATNITEAVLPTLVKIKETANPAQAKLIETMERDLREISSPFLETLKSRRSKLTPRETEVSRLIKNGMSSKEIAETLGLAIATVHKHREMIRRKLGLANEDVNLATYLQSL